MFLYVFYLSPLQRKVLDEKDRSAQQHHNMQTTEENWNHVSLHKVKELNVKKREQMQSYKY